MYIPFKNIIKNTGGNMCVGLYTEIVIYGIEDYKNINNKNSKYTQQVGNPIQ